MEATPDSYGWVAKYYDRVLEPLNAPLRQLALRQIPTGPGTRVLDVGCGTGAHLEAYAATGASCWGVDLSPAMLTVAEDRLPDAADLRIEDATELPFDTGFFDVVFTSLFLHELDPDARSEALAEMGRVTNPNGNLLIIDYRPGSLRWKGWAWRALSMATERIAGRRHYREWRMYLAEGGMLARLPDHLDVESERVVAGGNLAIWILRHRAEAA